MKGVNWTERPVGNSDDEMYQYWYRFGEMERVCQILGAATLKRQAPDKVRTNEQITFLTKMSPVFIQSPPSAVSVTLSAFAAERPLLHHGASSTAPAARRLQRSIDISCPQGTDAA